MSRLNIYSKEQIDANVGSSEDTASASGTLWARLKNAVARIVGLETADAQNVKLTGAQTIAGQKTLSDSPIVPTTPTTATGAVNSVYVNDATDGVNNIVHKSGNEMIGGIKSLTSSINIKALNIDIANPPATWQGSPNLQFIDTNNQRYCRMFTEIRDNVINYRCDIYPIVGQSEPTAGFQLQFNKATNTCVMILRKNINGVYSEQELGRI